MSARCQHVSPSPWGPTQCALKSGHTGRHVYSPSESLGDHPHTDPQDGRPQCPVCGKFVWPVTHSCKGVRVADPDPDAPEWPEALRQP